MPSLSARAEKEEGDDQQQKEEEEEVVVPCPLLVGGLLAASAANNTDLASQGRSSTVSRHSYSSVSASVSTGTSVTLADLPLTTPDLPLYRRQDLVMGKLLGRGRYSQVHEVVSITKRQSSSCSVTNNTNSRSDQEQTQDNSKQEQRERRYVMKHLQSKLFQNRCHRRFAKDLTNALADLVLEAMYLSKLSHPHIVQLRGLTRGGTAVLKQKNAVAEDYFILLDRMTETLDQRIHSVWKPEAEVRPAVSLEHLFTKLYYAHQIADALSYLHDHRILYRDLKPENIGFNASSSCHGDRKEQETLQLFDFGLARELDEPVDNVSRVYTLNASGTRRYMAPEIFNTGRYNYMADTYSFAMVVYEMICLKKPFQDFTCASHDELVCKLGGRPRLDEIVWPHYDFVNCSDDLAVVSERISQQMEELWYDTWKQDWRERLTMGQVLERLEEILEWSRRSKMASSLRESPHECLQKRKGTMEREGEEESTTTGSTPWQPGTLSQLGTAPATPAVIFLKTTKACASEMTVATDPVVSDSELDEDNQSHSQQSQSQQSQQTTPSQTKQQRLCDVSQMS